MRLLFCCAFLMGCLLNSQFSTAAVVFSTGPANQSVVQGNSLTFDIFLRSDGSNVNVEALEFNVLAGAGNVSGGVFTGGTTAFLGGVGSNPMDFSAPGQGFWAGAGTPIQVTGTNQLFGTLTLGTASATTFGTPLSITFDFVSIGTPIGETNPGATTVGSTIASYSISAVPEPTSIALVSLIGGAAGVRFWRKKRAAAV